MLQSCAEKTEEEFLAFSSPAIAKMMTEHHYKIIQSSKEQSICRKVTVTSRTTPNPGSHCGSLPLEAEGRSICKQKQCSQEVCSPCTACGVHSAPGSWMCCAWEAFPQLPQPGSPFSVSPWPMTKPPHGILGQSWPRTTATFQFLVLTEPPSCASAC